ncbi:3-dehydroquinate synthase [Pirellulaceae bacterium SH501]
MTTTVQVDLQERSYRIWIGTDQWDENLSHSLEALQPIQHAFLIWDEHLESIRNAMEIKLSARGVRTQDYQVSSGEGSKSVATLSEIWESMLKARTDRKSVVIAIGGGVVGDLAGFAAATYMRGIRFLQIPTTLLAMVDSSVGGKTGINLPQSKNAIGAFWQPHAVLIDTSVLKSLPEREFRSGIAEIVKYGVILDSDLFDWIEQNVAPILSRDSASLEKLIQRSCELKAHVVANDERETTGLRAILNYGHTFGHAIEAITTYGKYLHGEAIAIGMTMAGWLAAEKGLWLKKDWERQTSLLSQLKLPTRCESGIECEAMLTAMQTDKKNEHGVLNLILPTRLGEVRSVKGLALDDVARAIRAFT